MKYLFMGTADTLLETFWFLADSNNFIQKLLQYSRVGTVVLSGEYWIIATSLL